MKRLKLFFTFAVVLVSLTVGGLCAFAATEAAEDATSAPDISAASQASPIMDITPDTPYEPSQQDEVSVGEQVPADKDGEVGDTSLTEDNREDTQPQKAPSSNKGSNTPYFVGAVIAVLVFIGVALYCKFNGGIR